MPGLELIKNLAELDQQLAAKVEETRRVAAQRIKSAEEEGKRLLAEAEAQIQQMQEESRIRIAAASSKFAEEARALAATEKEHLVSQALPNIGRAVAFILSEIIP
jgi:vacuolar-type H+-ATPase subunit H